jgi:hypothetical protein
MKRNVSGFYWWLMVSATLIVGLAASCDGRSPPDEAELARVEELGLTRRIPWQVRTACEDAERFATVRVVCPRLIPDVRITTMKGSFGAAVGREQPHMYMMSFDKDFFGSTPPPAGVKHWVVGGGDGDTVKKWVLSDFAHEVEGDARLVRTVQRDGYRVMIHQFPEFPAGGLNGSHVAALIGIGDEVVYASLHGERYLDVAIEMAVDLAEQAAEMTPDDG